MCPFGIKTVKSGLSTLDTQGPSTHPEWLVCEFQASPWRPSAPCTGTLGTVKGALLGLPPLSPPLKAQAEWARCRFHGNPLSSSGDAGKVSFQLNLPGSLPAPGCCLGGNGGRSAEGPCLSLPAAALLLRSTDLSLPRCYPGSCSERPSLMVGEGTCPLTSVFQTGKGSLPGARGSQGAKLGLDPAYGI